ncbi:MAG: C1 family peptidase, partial [Verrucomicrobiota bacterium]
ALDAGITGQLEVGDEVYYNVKIMRTLPDSIIIRHSKGIAQIPMEELPLKWQRQLGYDPAKAEAFRQAVAAKEAERKAEAAKKAAAKPPAPPASTTTVADRVLPLFGTAPVIAERVDLRPDFRELGLYAKDQGRRPSCAVFSVVSALEYQQAKNRGQAKRLSEEYLIWATRKSLGLEQAALNDPADLTGDADLGFTLMEVVQALRAYGIADADSMPNTFGKRMAEITEPDKTTVTEARERRQVHAFSVTGRSNEARLERIFHLLNNDVPVVVGMAWPHYRTLRSPLISQQNPRPGSGHAVTLVGYKSETGNAEDARFLFKNSWGPQWGNAGYGWVTWEYLRQHLGSAVFLDCQ